MLEVYFNTDHTTLVVESPEKGDIKPLKEMGIKFHKDFDSAILAQYPDAWEKLSEIHGDNPKFAYARVHNFCACNFSFKDGKPDIDEDFNFNLENVPCPARVSGICSGGICFPKITQELSPREIQVLRLFASGLSEEEIGETLIISPHTVHNHINNMYKKLDFVGKSVPNIKLVNYAHRKKLLGM